MAAMLHEVVAVSLGKTAVADTTSETTSAVVDLANADEVLFVVNFEDVDAAAVLTFTLKENTASSTSSPAPTTVSLDTVMTNLAATSLGAISSGALVITESSDNLDNKTVLIAAKKSAFSKRYVFLSVTVADESYALVSIQTLVGGYKKLPATHGSEVVAGAFVGK